MCIFQSNFKENLDVGFRFCLDTTMTHAEMQEKKQVEALQKKKTCKTKEKLLLVVLL